jgi:hypothetical protein
VKNPKEETTYGLSPDRLAKLLALGLESEKDQDDLEEKRTAAEALDEMLSRKLSPEKVKASDKTVGDLLIGADTDPSLIETLKDYGKELVRGADSETRKAAATAIYYAAIASALLSHGKKITQHSYGRLQKAYEDLEQKDWVPSDLKDLFGKAKAACQEKKS